MQLQNSRLSERLATLALASLVIIAPLSTAPESSAPPSFAGAAEKQELFWPDGSLRASYHLDAGGRLDGAYLEFFENGKQKLKAYYKRDRLQGRYESFASGGQRVLRCTYDHGILHGKYEEFDDAGELRLRGEYAEGARAGEFRHLRAGQTISKQLWEADELALLEGLEPYPRSRAQLRAGLQRIHDSEQTSTAPTKRKPPKFDIDADGDLSPAARAAQDVGRDGALRRLMAYRFLVGLEWSDMTLDDSYNHFASMAARLLVKVGELNHTPANPGLPGDEYRAGYRGTSSSNLARGSSLVGSINSYMDDSDPSNIDRIGHRLWCLNPAMLRTGFGLRGSFSAMWSFDANRSKIPALELVAYPPAGFMPAEYFGPRHAWSVQFLGSPLAGAALKDLFVRVFPLDENFLRSDAALELDHLGQRGSTLIFRPAGVSVLPGSRYWVEIGRRKGAIRKASLRYLVEFTELAAEDN